MTAKEIAGGLTESEKRGLLSAPVDEPAKAHSLPMSDAVIDRLHGLGLIGIRRDSYGAAIDVIVSCHGLAVRRELGGERCLGLWRNLGIESVISLALMMTTLICTSRRLTADWDFTRMDLTLF